MTPTVNNDMDEEGVDLVYLWVNGNDPEWRAKRNAAIGETVSTSAVNCDGRYADNDELRYSLRSVDLYAPWLHKIYIVTDNQVPEWLDTSNPKISIIDHKEIMPPESLPCFNSAVIEHFICRIPGLKSRFLYANDDMCLNRPVTEETFFAPDGLPIIRQNRRLFRKWYLAFKEKVMGKKLSNYNRTVDNVATLVEKRFGTYYGGKAHHNIDSYRKEDCMHTEAIFEKEIAATLCNHCRQDNDVQRSLYHYVALAEHRGHRRYVSQKESLRIHIQNRSHYKKLENYNPLFFCMNDSEYANDEDRRYSARFLKKRFPGKSQFEK